VLVGINLLREGLDLPEVALVAILDADKEGFLRSRTSLIQTCGRAARNVEGRVIFYADRRPTRCARDRRGRAPAQAPGTYNAEHGIDAADDHQADARLDRVAVRDGLRRGRGAARGARTAAGASAAARPAAAELEDAWSWPADRLRGEIEKARADMLRSAQELRFEEAARLRDRVQKLEGVLLKR
jgi:excinuclease ABC subunit B